MPRRIAVRLPFVSVLLGLVLLPAWGATAGAVTHDPHDAQLAAARAQIAQAQRLLGGSGSLAARIQELAHGLGGSGTLAARAHRLATLERSSASTITQLKSQNTSLNTQLGTVTADDRSQVTQLQGCTSQVNTALGLLGGTGSLDDRVSALIASGSGNSALISTATALVGGSSGTLTDRLTALQAMLGSSGDLTALVNGILTQTGGSGTETARLGAIENALRAGGSQTNVTGDVGVLRSVVTASAGANLEADLTTLKATLGGSGTAQARASNILSGVLTSSPTNVTDDLARVDGELLTTPTGVLETDLHTVRTKLVATPGLTAQADVATISTLLGGSGTTVQARGTALDGALLTTPTNVLSIDLGTLRNMLVASPGATAQADVSTINTLIGGSGSTVQANIGTPTVNSTPSSLAAMIGGSGSDIASRLGDPITGTTGVSALIRNNGSSLGTVNGHDETAFDNATSLYDQLNAVSSIFGAGGNVPTGSYASLHDVLAAFN